MENTTKQCRKCETDKPLSDFSLNATAHDKKQSWCKQCQSVHRIKTLYTYDDIHEFATMPETLAEYQTLTRYSMRALGKARARLKKFPNVPQHCQTVKNIDSIFTIRKQLEKSLEPIFSALVDGQLVGRYKKVEAALNKYERELKKQKLKNQKV